MPLWTAISTILFALIYCWAKKPKHKHYVLAWNQRIMEFLTNVSLKDFTTFGVETKTHLFCELRSENDIVELLQSKEYRQYPTLFLGGGSNLLFVNDFPGITAKIALMGKSVVHESDTFVELDIQAGESWHECVRWCLDCGYYGLENLALIPGTVGAAPIQNIGAYGIEIKSFLMEVRGISTETGETIILNNSQCNFNYRDSIFKKELRNQMVIVSIRLRLSKISNVNISYRDVNEYLFDNNISSPSPADVFSAVVAIRTKKLPNPKILGNAGSFFKNPIVSLELFSELQKEFPEIPYYETENSTMKIPAAWLIQQCGWKGFRMGDAGVSPIQPLALINYGTATGNDILELSESIRSSIFSRFSIMLETEVNIIR